MALVVALLAALALPALASASGSAVIKDCTLDGQLNKTYSQKDYADALANLPADVDEYSDCRDVIRRAQLGGAGGGRNSSGGGGGGGTAGGGTGGGTTGGGTGAGATGGDAGTAATPQTDPFQGASDEEKASYQKAVQTGSAPVQLDGRPVTPADFGGAQSTGFSDLPAPLLALLALLAAGAVAALALGTRRVVNGRRTA